MVNNTVIAIDPGREKCGVAVVHRTRGVLGQRVVNTAEVVPIIANLAAEYTTCKIALGDSTYSKHLQSQLRDIQIGEAKLDIQLINEYRSTDEGKQRYWRANPPQGFRRFIPVTMQAPPVPVDDYAAIILAERYFKAN